MRLERFPARERRQTPCLETHQVRVIGEPDASKGARPVRRGADNISCDQEDLLPTLQLTIPASKAVKFKAGKTLSEKVK